MSVTTRPHNTGFIHASATDWLIVRHMAPSARSPMTSRINMQQTLKRRRRSAAPTVRRPQCIRRLTTSSVWFTVECWMFTAAFGFELRRTVSCPAVWLTWVTSFRTSCYIARRQSTSGNAITASACSSTSTMTELAGQPQETPRIMTLLIADTFVYKTTLSYHWLVWLLVWRRFVQVYYNFIFYSVWQLHEARKNRVSA